ncbi:MAG TPA: S41 family peptidase [Thermoanaerobaculia bacterium]|nr:S41 family peptidase [Thermoanaerobaculia bacterium]
MRNPAVFRAARFFSLLVGLLPAALHGQAASTPLPAPTNLDFEQGQPGEVPPGWSFSATSRENGYTARIVADHPEAGKQAAELAFAGEKKDPRAFGNLLTSFDAIPYRGQRIRFRAAVRAEVAGSDGAGLWLRVDREGGGRGFFDNMTDRPITSPTWKSYEIVGDVAPDAKVIFIGLLLPGGGKAWIDSASIAALGAVETRHEPARPLAGRGLDNLIAFARLFGDVRYFHPSDQAAAADWEKLALAGVQTAEKAADPAELARTLEGLFRPLAPTVRVFLTGGPRPVLPAELKAAAGTTVIHWEHLGLQVSARPNVYKSRRVTAAPAAAGAQIPQILDATSYRGKRVTVRAAARAEVPGDHPAVLKLRAGKATAEPALIAETAPPITANEWRTYEISGEVPKDADWLEIDLGLTAGGRVWWDDLSLEVAGGAAGVANPIPNGDFETPVGDDSPAAWEVDPDSIRAGYRAVLSTDHPKSGRRSLLLSWSKPDPASVPQPGEPLVADLGGGVSALVPLALYEDAQGTLPHAPVAATPVAGASPEPIPSGNDRATRLADVVLAWNVFQHFYPYFDVVQADWPGELRRALTTAATDADERAFLVTLRHLVAALHDGHGNVSGSFEGAPARLPLLWDWVEDQLVVTQVAPAGAGELRPGDLVVSLNGRPAREALTAIEELVSGATPQWRRWVALQQLAQGEPAAAVRIEARHTDGTAVTATLSHSTPSFGSGSLVETRPEKISEPRPGILYVNLDQINDADFKGALDRLAAARGVVFDLRGYPRNVSPAVLSHLTDRPITSARWNIPVVTRPDRQGWEWNTAGWYLPPEAPRLKGKIAFVTDGRAISYAESYMGIVEAYHLGEIVGNPTAGTNGNINPFALPGGYRLVWTGMKVTKQDGSRHHGVGIQPTVPVARTIQGVAAGRDELLEKAIAVVGQ